MKKNLLLSATVLFVLASYAQVETLATQWYANEVSMGSGIARELMYDVHGRSNLPVKKEILQKADFLHDLIPYYPVHWIDDYLSVELAASVQGKVLKGLSTNDALNEGQKKILNTVDVGTDLALSVKYISINSSTGLLENKNMNVTITVMPETDAAYVGGYQKLSKFLWDHAISKINERASRQLQQAVVQFTVSEEGGIGQAKITVSSGDPKTDSLLIEAVNKMPNWIPAESSKGKKVKQEFEFSVYGGEHGC